MKSKEQISKYAILSVVYISFAVLFWPFKTALLLSSLFAMAMTPLINRCLTKIDREKLLIFCMVAGLIIMIIAPLTLIITKGILSLGQLQQDTVSQLPLYKNAESTITTVWNFFNDIAARFHLDLNENFDVQSLLPRILQFVVPALTALVTNFPEFLLQLFVFVTTLCFFLVKRREFLGWFKQRELVPDDSLMKLVTLLQKVCYSVLFSTLVVAAVQASIITIAASIAGFGSLMIIFVLTFFMSFLPVVGAAPVALALAAFSFLQGSSGDGIIMIVALGISATVDNIIRAFMLGGEEEIHPLVSLLTLIGALAVFGMSGLFLGPIIAELAFAIGGIMNGSDQKVELPPVAVEASEPAPRHSP
ncbi:hypothetical protein CIK05_01940 [Bdellovibrio sp. qaytius]|nr:hypothetical protein CIK05_01940 [Bdellovibrio sp. qaytius]